ncbi:MAG TPA: hypothetical protein PLG72_06185 [Clostridiales bacterium]|nr:hypothetical protein [Clostridiales bacterium]HOL92096.1 hypothetical protein [Clostridiales bacterium]
MRLRNVLAAMAVAVSLLLAACVGSTPIEKYMNEDIAGIGVEKNMEEAGTMLEEILGECAEKLENGEEVDWDEVEQKVDPVLAGMQETRDKVAQLEITDEDVKEINSYLVSTYDKLISGYEKMIAGFRDMDDELINEGSDDLTGAQEDILKWYELIEEAIK